VPQSRFEAALKRRGLMGSGWGYRAGWCFTTKQVRECVHLSTPLARKAALLNYGFSATPPRGRNQQKNSIQDTAQRGKTSACFRDEAISRLPLRLLG
jgi:hypothetical protein